MKNFLNFLIIVFSFLFLFSKQSLAITYELIAPSGEFNKGDEVQFTINVDTQNQSYSSTQVGMTYDTQYLEFISVLPGDTFPTVSANQIENGKLILTGTKEDGFSETGVFAYVKFKIIASAPGSTELCVLFNPEITPTPNPSQSQPLPTQLITSGVVSGNIYTIVGVSLITIAGLGFFIFKNLIKL